MADYEDDHTINDEDALWRRIPPLHFVPNAESGIRISSAAFKDHPNGSPMSVDLAKVVTETGRGPEDIIRAHKDFALASITAGLARACRQGVARDPLPEEPAHALVFGKKTKAIRRKLASGSSWVIPPNSVKSLRSISNKGNISARWT